MIAPTPVLHLLQRSSHASTVRPPPASTFRTCFNGPHMQSRVFTIFTSERGLNVSHTSLAHVQHARERVVARDVCLLLYKFHSRVSYFLSFQLCVSWLYLIACLQYNLYCR